MPTPNQKQSLIDAVGQIRLAEQLLLAASRSTSDPIKLIQINTEYTHLDSYLSQILHTQALSDDVDFGNATDALKNQTSVLTVEINSISKIVDDVATAGKIVGFITKAIQIIGAI
jgi:hypothetical protein